MRRACLKEAQTDGAVGAKCSRFRRPGRQEVCRGARREICDDREMLFNVFRGGARPSSIASTPLSILHRCIRGEESSQIILEVIGLPLRSVGGKDCVVSRMAGKHPILAKLSESTYLVKKGQKSKKMNSVFGEQRVRRCR